MRSYNTTILHGLFLGYPSCCIAEHVERLLKRQHAPTDRKLRGTGYVPCAVCNEKSEDELRATIAAQRDSNIPFPKDNRMPIDALRDSLLGKYAPTKEAHDGNQPRDGDQAAG